MNNSFGSIYWFTNSACQLLFNVCVRFFICSYFFHPKSSSFQICMIVLLFFYFPKLLFYFFKYMKYFFYIWYTIVPNSKDSMCVYVCVFVCFVLFSLHTFSAGSYSYCLVSLHVLYIFDYACQLS